MSTSKTSPSEASLAQSLGAVTLATPSSSNTTVLVDDEFPPLPVTPPAGEQKKRKQRSNDSLGEAVETDKGNTPSTGKKEGKIRRKVVVKVKSPAIVQSRDVSDQTGDNGNSNKETLIVTAHSARDGVTTSRTIVHNVNNKQTHVPTSRSLKDYFKPKNQLSSTVQAVDTTRNRTLEKKNTKMDDLQLNDEPRDEEMQIDGILPLGDEGRALFRRMAKIRDKLLRFELHYEFMSKYQEEEKLPKGLRIIKDPYFGEPIEDFDTEWQQVLTQASKRLLDITCKKLEYLVASLNQQWLDLESELDELSAPEEIKISMLEKVHAWAAQKEPKLREVKNAKWERDLNYKPRERKRPGAPPPAQQKPKVKVVANPNNNRNPNAGNNHGKQRTKVNQYKNPQATHHKSQHKGKGKGKGKSSTKGKDLKNYKIPKKSKQTRQEEEREEKFKEMMASFFKFFKN